ncbi:unnamed protein product [Rotaria sp. Silwood2]|nr:unnamed protein product [Rotaria sp. Silwood2]CAF2975235.1 unnamed protein product [Rotaria sp. Silwood2]CAF3346521.1 unnamed protein product [Rotaria sp. Silwood2]CAF4300304.1 unnamed protein product [Rotaria sp. Silwood2]CAF4302041.1 unnamed protein product [Rotaria sp. Silwood2]
MSILPSTNNLTKEVLSFRNDAFYNLVEQQCGTVVLEIMQAQDISSVDCLLDINNIFNFLELDSDELIPLKRKAGILLNDGRFVVKKGIMHKVETFLHTLHHLNHQNTTSCDNLNNSSDLIISEQLLQKLPFIRTLIIYSNLICNSKIDFTFLNVILNNMIRNFITEERGYRYDTIVRQFASCLYILGGRTAYEFVRLNIPGFLPSVQIIQSYIGTSENHLAEGLFNYIGACDYLNINQSTLGFCAEDSTAVVPKITYDTTSNTFIGFSLPLDDNGVPIIDSYSTDSFTRLEQWCSDLPLAKSLSACLVQPLSTSVNNISPYPLAAYGTDSTFKSSDVILRWRHIYEQFKAKGIRIVGFSTDCDSLYLHAMRISLGFFGMFTYDDHPDLLAIDLPTNWSWFFMQHEQLYVCIQDPIHICTKLRNRLLSKTAALLLGNQLINIEPLLYIIENFSKFDHALVLSDIDPKDRQNFKSCTKISNDNVLILLEQVPNAIGISIYLKVGKRNNF